MTESTAHRTTLVSVLILARNEALHIARAVTSARRLTPHVYVVDADSSDGTAAIARAAGATVHISDIQRFADKLNWGADHIEFPSQWVFRLDADEILTDSLVEELPKLLACVEPDIAGIYLRRQLWFMGQWIRFGGMYPTYSMRLWRRGLAYCEIRDLDEYMILRTGTSQHANLDVIDNPLFDLGTWVTKHNGYSTLEALAASAEQLDTPNVLRPALFGTHPQRVRWLKLNVFYRLPLFVRPFLYFFYRYFVRLGFLDGRIGFVFHFMHGLWYRLLVDGKILESRLPRRD